MTDWLLKSIQVGMPRRYIDGDREWLSAIFKTPVSHPVAAGRLGLAGDGVGDTKNHGGTDKAVCCHPWQHYEYWNAYFQWDLRPGAVGENFTLDGLTEIDVCVGDIWHIGDARFQVSQPRVPCWKQNDKLQQRRFDKLVMQTGRSGFYLRVLEEGTVQAGDVISLSERPFPNATIVRLNRALHEKNNHALAEEFAELEPLAASWREMFIGRTQKQKESG